MLQIRISEHTGLYIYTHSFTTYGISTVNAVKGNFLILYLGYFHLPSTLTFCMPTASGKVCMLT